MMSEFKNQAPEQEAALYLRYVEGEGTDWTQVKELADKWLSAGYQVQSFYTHADKSEVERLRAELELWKRRSGGNLYAAQVMEGLADEQEDELVTVCQKLADAQALLCRVRGRGLYDKVGLDGDIDSFLSATAQPAECQTCSGHGFLRLPGWMGIPRRVSCTACKSTGLDKL